MSHNVYAAIGKQTDVASASPHKLIELLLDKCIDHIQTSKRFMQEKNIALKCETIGMALDIVEHLRVSLNRTDEAAKEMTEKLDAVYDYCERKLIEANTKNSQDILDEVYKLIDTVRSGWKEIGQGAS